VNFMSKIIQTIKIKFLELEKIILKKELLIPLMLILVIVIDISLTREQIMQMNELGVIPTILQPLFILVFFVVLPIKSYTWLIIYNLIILFFSYYSYKYGKKHNQIFIKLIWMSLLLTYFLNLIVRFEKFSPFWDYFLILYFPLFLCCLNGFDVFFQRNKETLNQIWEYLKAPIIYIGIVFIVALISQTAVISYGDTSKIGMSGWYVSSNSIGHLLTITFPILVYYLLNNVKNKVLWLALILSLFAQFAIGTKAPFFGMNITLSIFLMFTIFQKVYLNEKILSRSIIIILLMGTVFIAYNFSPLKHNLETKGGITEIDLASGRYDFLEDRREDRREDRAASLLDYSKYLLILNGHNSIKIKLIEVDYIDIVYNNGIVGGIVFIIILGFYLTSAVKNYYCNLKKNLNLETLSYFVSVFLMLGIAYYAGHIFVGSYIAIYSAFIIAIFYARSFKYEK